MRVLFEHISMCTKCVPGACSGQNRVSDVPCLWVLSTEPESSGGAASAPNLRGISPVPDFTFNFKYASVLGYVHVGIVAHRGHGGSNTDPLQVQQ